MWFITSWALTFCSSGICWVISKATEKKKLKMKYSFNLAVLFNTGKCSTSFKQAKKQLSN